MLGDPNYFPSDDEKSVREIWETGDLNYTFLFVGLCDIDGSGGSRMPWSISASGSSGLFWQGSWTLTDDEMLVNCPGCSLLPGRKWYVDKERLELAFLFQGP